MLIINGATITDQQREPLLLFANQIALAVDRAQLREQALRAELTEEVAHLARTLVAAVSHDLRAPLSSIKASSSILADPQLDGALDSAARQELAALIDTQSDRLAALVTNVLDMSRVQAGVLKPRASVSSVADLVANVVADLQRDSPARHTDIQIPGDLPPVDIDTVLIGRVLTNLLDNASRHAPPNTPITIRAERSNPRLSPSPSPTAVPASPSTAVKRSSACSFAVKPTPAPASDWRSPRPSSTRTANESGSTPHPEAARPSVSPSPSLPTCERSIEMATVLVIDDDTALLAACRVGLRALGHQVRTAATGDAGLSDAAVYPPDVVVLDLGLPDMDGMGCSLSYGNGPQPL